MEATIRDLRLHTAEVLAAADRGERVTIASRGRLRWVSMRGEGIRPSAHAGRNPAFGLWADRQGTVDDDVRRLRQPRVLP